MQEARPALVGIDVKPLDGFKQIDADLRDLELPEAYSDWLASEISKQMGLLDLERNIRWEGTILWTPNLPPFLGKDSNGVSFTVNL